MWSVFKVVMGNFNHLANYLSTWMPHKCSISCVEIKYTVLQNVIEPVRKEQIRTSVASKTRIEPSIIPKSTPSLETTKSSILTDQIFNNLQVNQLGETFSTVDVSVSEIAAAGEWNEEKRKEIGKNLREKHTLECVEHENELRAEEIKVNEYIMSNEFDVQFHVE